jgi:hypothetical protein
VILLDEGADLAKTRFRVGLVAAEFGAPKVFLLVIWRFTIVMKARKFKSIGTPIAM